jgi:hypothetical protein
MEIKKRWATTLFKKFFDRYGKLIELNVNYSWDGKFNSKIYLQMIIGTHLKLDKPEIKRPFYIKEIS